MRKQVLSLLVENNPGVTSHISGLFSRRGYNIDSFSSGVTADPRYTRITIVATGDEQILEQIEKQLAKLEDVVDIKKLEKLDALEEWQEKRLERLKAQYALIDIVGDEIGRKLAKDPVMVFIYGSSLGSIKNKILNGLIGDSIQNILNNPEKIKEELILQAPDSFYNLDGFCNNLCCFSAYQSYCL